MRIAPTENKMRGTGCKRPHRNQGALQNKPTFEPLIYRKTAPVRVFLGFFAYRIDVYLFYSFFSKNAPGLL